MLYSMKPLLEAAREGHYCVPAPNFDVDPTRRSNSGHIYAMMEVAEELNTPVIIDITRKDFTAFGDMVFQRDCAAAVAAAKRASVPVALNLDHGQNFESIVKSMFDGVSSVMFDGSHLPYAENVEKTLAVSRIAHVMGLSVEAEIGHVGTFDDSHPGGIIQSEEEVKKTYTNVEECCRFVKEAEVDAIAVAVGTVHGFYPEGFKPYLDLDLLSELNKECSVPLVLHGGSGVGEYFLTEAAKRGCTKLNIGHDLRKAAKEGLDAAYANGIPAKDPIGAYYDGYKAELKKYIGWLGSAGKAK